MSKSDANWVDLYESHLRKELKEHRKSFHLLKHILHQIKDTKKEDNSYLSGNQSNDQTTSSKEEESDNDSGLNGTDQTLSGIKEEEETDSETLVAKSDICPNDHLTFVNVKQYFICVEDQESKFDTVYQLLKTQDIDNVVIYCNTGEKCDSLTTFMESRGLCVKSFHHKKTNQKQRIINEFMSNNKSIQAIITVKRVESLKDVSFYINYDLPKRDTYIKKVGRIGMFGPKYAVINIITKSEFRTLLSYEKFHGTKIVPLPFGAQNLL